MLIKFLIPGTSKRDDRSCGGARMCSAVLKSIHVHAAMSAGALCRESVCLAAVDAAADVVEAVLPRSLSWSSPSNIWTFSAILTARRLDVLRLLPSGKQPHGLAAHLLLLLVPHLLDQLPAGLSRGEGKLKYRGQQVRRKHSQSCAWMWRGV